MCLAASSLRRGPFSWSTNLASICRVLAVLGMTETQESPRDPTTLVGSRADRSWKVIGAEEDIATRPGEAKHS